MNSGKKMKEFTFNDVLKMQQEEDKRKIEGIISVLSRHVIPTPDEIREDIRGLVGRRNELMRHHVFWEEHRLRLGLQSSFVLPIKLMLIYVVMMPLLAPWRGQMNLKNMWIIRSDTLLRRI